MATGESSGHDDVTWPWKVKVATPIRLGLSISKRLEIEVGIIHLGDLVSVTLTWAYVFHSNLKSAHNIDNDNA